MNCFLIDEVIGNIVELGY